MRPGNAGVAEGPGLGGTVSVENTGATGDPAVKSADAAGDADLRDVAGGEEGAVPMKNNVVGASIAMVANNSRNDDGLSVSRDTRARK